MNEPVHRIVGLVPMSREMAEDFAPLHTSLFSFGRGPRAEQVDPDGQWFRQWMRSFVAIPFGACPPWERYDRPVTWDVTLFPRLSATRARSVALGQAIRHGLADRLHRMAYAAGGRSWDDGRDW